MFNEIRNCNVEIVNNVYETRLHDGLVVRVPDHTNDKFKRFMPWLGPSLWNSLPSDIRNIPDYDRFVTDVKRDFNAHFCFDEYFW